MKHLCCAGIIAASLFLLFGCQSDVGPEPVLGPELEAFQTATGTFSSPDRTWTDFVVADGYVYVCGGSASDFLSDVQFAAIGSDGDIESFSATTPLPVGRAYHSCVAYNGYFYAIAGFTTSSGGSETDDIVYAPINTDGSLGAFSSASNALNTARAHFFAAAYDGYLYVFGGSIGVGIRSVEYAQIGANGDLGAFTELANHMTSNRSMHSGALAGDTVYLVGGRKTGSEDFDTVEYAQLTPGGVGTFTECTSTFTDSRENLECVAYNGYLYVIAGYTIDSTPDKLSDIQYAPIQADGELGAFTTTTASLSSYRWHGGAGVCNDRLYVLGGGTSSGWLGDSEYASFEPR